MKIDSLNKTSFEGVERVNSNPEKGLSSISDSPKSLSSPFVNPYRKPNTSFSTGKGKTAAERNNNPFNIKFGKFAASYGATKEDKPALDGGSFATFTSPQVGFQAAKDLLLGKNYRNLTVDQAMKRWSNSGYGGNIFPQVANKRVADLTPDELDNLQRKQIVREDKKYANKLGIYKYGGKLKSYQMGGNTAATNVPTGAGVDPNLVGMGLGLAGIAVESFDTNPKKVNKGAAIAGGALKGAGTGAALGSLVGPVGTAIGAVGGAVVGGIFGGKKANRRQATLNHTSALQNQTFNQQLQDRSAYLYRQMNPYQYKFGGNLKAEYEVEKDEVIQGTPILEDGKQITSNLHLVKGKKHEQGGTLGAGGDRVFSNSISFNGKTPAKIALKVGKQLQKFEPDLSSPDRMKRLTAEKMTTKLNQSLDLVFDAQEEFKETPKFKFGGNLPKFATGGTLDEKDERRIRTLENYLRDNPQDSGDSKRAIRAEIAKLRQRTPVNKQAVANQTKNTWDTLTTPNSRGSKLGIPITKDYFVGNDLNEVTIKGKRTLPGNKNTNVGAKKSTPTISPIRRNSFNSLNNLTTLSPRQSTNPLTKNLENIPVTQPKITNQSVANNRLGIDPTLAAGLGLSAIGYLNSANNIRRMNTDAPVNLTQSPYYEYRDRSRLARTDLQGTANTILRNPNVSSANKQAMFSRYTQGLNQINDQENSNRFQYDNQFAGQALQVDARNNAMLTQAQQERINNQNMKIAMQSQNFDNLLGGVASAIVDRDKRKLDRDKFGLLSNAYSRRYNTNFDVELPE